MKTGSQWRNFFRGAALFNFSAAILMLFFKPQFYHWLLIDETLGSAGKVWLDIFALLVAVFGLAYWRVSTAPGQHRDLVWVGMLAKMAVFMGAWYHALMFNSHFGFAVLVVADLVFALIFAYYLRIGIYNNPSEV
jgi:hypothetical protein